MLGGRKCSGEKLEGARVFGAGPIINGVVRADLVEKRRKRLWLREEQTGRREQPAQRLPLGSTGPCEGSGRVLAMDYPVCHAVRFAECLLRAWCFWPCVGWGWGTDGKQGNNQNTAS